MQMSLLGIHPDPDEAKTEAAKFVLNFQRFYETMSKQPYTYQRKHFILAARLIKQHGADWVMRKTKALGLLCHRREAWFTKNGWADFSIEKLSNKWNEILIGDERGEKQRKNEELLAELKRREAAHA